ncbi:MAG: hypothetical protein JOY79_05490, partial [Acidobacteriaceae bacterium]|nr:hypothetical protein [Acidobacteriaceae bacterium]
MLSTTSGSETVSASESSATAHSTDAADDQPITFRKRVDEVAVVFTVANKHGHPVKDLQREAFQVLDDHKPPRDIVSFVHQTDMPLRVGLL